MRRPPCLLVLALAWLLAAAVPLARAAEEALSPLIEEIAQGWERQLRLLAFATTLAPAEAARNPDNRIMQLARYGAGLHLRPDFKLALPPLTLSLQPRIELQGERWQEGPGEGRSQRAEEAFVHQGLARWACTEGLQLSYGRENLQWGPAALTSPSNPFFRDNGRANPKKEVAAMEFARAVWMLGASSSLSLIANTGDGRSEGNNNGFSGAWAVKGDYNRALEYGSLILAAGPRGGRQIGGYYGRTLSEALLIYAEGALRQDPGGWYPEPDAGPLGMAMRPPTIDEGDSWKTVVLWGGAYTLEQGASLTAEYLMHGSGYDRNQAEAFFDLQARAAGVLDPPGPLTPLGYEALSRTADPGLRFLRRNYLLLQYLQSDIAGVLNLTLRWTQNLDDGSGRLAGIGEWSLGDHLQLFALATANRGASRTEFGSIFTYQVMLGLEYIF